MFIYLPTFSESNVWDFCLIFMTEISTKNFPLEISDYQYFLETSEHGLKCWKMFQQPLSIFQSYLKGSIVFFAQINVKRPFGIFFFLAAGGVGGGFNWIFIVTSYHVRREKNNFSGCMSQAWKIILDVLEWGL